MHFPSLLGGIEHYKGLISKWNHLLSLTRDQSYDLLQEKFLKIPRVEIKISETSPGVAVGGVAVSTLRHSD